MSRLFQKSWFKGGAIGATLILLLATIAIIFMQFNLAGDIGDIILVFIFFASTPITTPLLPIIQIACGAGGVGGEPCVIYAYIFSILPTMIEAFLIGAVVGWLASKIRSKQPQSTI